MQIKFLKNVFRENGQEIAISWRATNYSYKWLLDHVENWEAQLELDGVLGGEVVALEGDFSPNTIALLLALTAKNCIVVPHNISNSQERDYRFETAQVQICYSFDSEDNCSRYQTGSLANHALYQEVRQLEHPGLVLFTSGTSGKPKAAIHDFARLLEKFKAQRVALKTLNFLLFDHWGGLNTLFHTLSNAGCVFTLENRRPETICALIERYSIELLPASPTFLNLMLLSGAHKKYDMRSIKTITYGTEPMPMTTLIRLRESFPGVKLHQTYGLIELGVLRSKSKDDSLWIKIGGDGFETRVVDGVLHIKARSAMLGYINAPSPFTEDGWFVTGDLAEIDGEYFRILGRNSERINVGGDKVSPAEVENVILQMDNVADVTVYGENNPLIGSIVCARVRLIAEESRKDFMLKLKKFCSLHLQPYKIPVKLVLTDTDQYTERFKKTRNF